MGQTTDFFVVALCLAKKKNVCEPFLASVNVQWGHWRNGNKPIAMALGCCSATALLLLGAVSALTPAKSFEWVSVLTNATAGFCTGEDTSGMEEVKQNENSRQETTDHCNVA